MMSLHRIKLPIREYNITKPIEAALSFLMGLEVSLCTYFQCSRLVNLLFHRNRRRCHVELWNQISLFG